MLFWLTVTNTKTKTESTLNIRTTLAFAHYLLAKFLKGINRRFKFYCSPEKVAEGILILITDSSLNGKIMKISPRRGHYYEEYESIEEFTANA